MSNEHITSIKQIAKEMTDLPWENKLVALVMFYNLGAVEREDAIRLLRMVAEELESQTWTKKMGGVLV